MASDVDFRIVFARLTGFLNRGNTWHLSGKDVGYVGYRGFHQGLVVDGRDSSCNGSLGLGAVSYHHRCLNGLGVIPEDNGNVALLAHGNLLRGIAKRYNLQDRRFGRNGKGELTVHVGSRAGGGALDGDTSTDDRQAFGVNDRTLDGYTLLGKGRSPAQEYHQTPKNSQSR